MLSQIVVYALCSIDECMPKKKLNITLYPDEIKLLREFAKQDCKRSLSSMIGKMINNYKP